MVAINDNGKINEISYLLQQTKVMMEIMLRDNKLHNTKFYSVYVKHEKTIKDWNNTLKLYNKS